MPDARLALGMALVLGLSLPFLAGADDFALQTAFVAAGLLSLALASLPAAGAGAGRAPWLAALLLLAGALPSLALTPARHLGLLGCVRLLAGLGFLLGAATLARDPTWRRRVLLALGATAALLALVGLADIVWPEPMVAHWVGAEQRASLPFRVRSLMVNPNLWGAYCAVGAPVALAAAAAAPGWGEAAAPLALGLALVLNLVGSFSRGAWCAAALAGGLSLFLARRRRARLPMLVAVVALAVGAGLLSLATPAVRSRLASVGQGSELGVEQRSLLYRGVVRHVLAHLPAGSGPKTFQTLFPAYRLAGGQYPYEAHSDVLQVAAEAGIPGVLGLAGFVFALGRPAASALSTGGGSAAPMAALLGFAFACQFVTFLHYAFLTVPLMVLLGALGPGPDGAPGPHPRWGTAAFALAAAAAGYWGLVLASQGPLDRALAMEKAGRAAGGELGGRLLEAAAGQAARAEATLPWRDDAPYARARTLRELAEVQPAGEDRKKNLTTAEASGRRAVSLNPYEATYAAEVAAVAATSGDAEGERVWLARARAFDPWSENLARLEARRLERAGDVGGALEVLRTTLESNPAFWSVNREAFGPLARDLVGLLERSGRGAEARRAEERYRAALE